jgi:bisphosphoglycerate-independent phosphoglycerate mutase (AlkP superfamily)
MMIHVIPLDDTNCHSMENHLCACDPKIKDEGGTLIVIHNSYDGREALEQANEILNIMHISDKKWDAIVVQ